MDQYLKDCIVVLAALCTKYPDDIEIKAAEIILAKLRAAEELRNKALMIRAEWTVTRGFRLDEAIRNYDSAGSEEQK